MISKEGFALAQYINNNSDRYRAGTFEFNDSCWVLVNDCDALDNRGYPHTFEPIADIEPYLVHARQHSAHFPEDLVCLIETWTEVFYGN